MLNQIFSLLAFGVLGLCFSGIFMVLFNNLFDIDKW